MLLISLAGGLLLLAQPIMAQFNLYPAISPSLLASSLNISSGCLSALNATVNCDSDLFQMAGNADGYFWANENATGLCTSQCLSSASSWWAKTADACENDQLNAYGRLYPAESVPGRFLDGLNIVCLTANTDVTQDVGINGTVVTFTDIGGYNSTVDTSSSDPPSLPDTPLGRRQSSASSPYCIVQSYDWIGSDVIRPDCDNPANANNAQCLDPTDVPADNSRIANLYPDSLLCSQCFLKMFYLRLASPYLPDADHSDDMVAQWFDILDVCNAKSSMPDLIVRTIPYYQPAPGSSLSGADNATDSVMPMPLGNGTCAGRVIALANIPEPSIDYSTQTPCDTGPSVLKVSTGDLIQAMGSPSCMPNFDTTANPSICIPSVCHVGLMPNATTCDQFAQSLSTANATVTTTQLLSWNPNFIGLCSNTTQQYVCIGAPGGTYVPPPVNTTANDGSQQRGGGNGGGTSTGSGGTRNSTYVQPGQAAPGPTQSGIPASCTRYAMAEAGDGCTTFASSFGLTLQMLVTLNPVLGVNGANCGTMLEAGEYYCLGTSSGVSSSGTTSPTATSTSTTASTPSPVQSGINPQCTEYAMAASEEWCSEFAPKYNITTAQLYAWNPILGVNGASCDTLFQAGEYYCVGAPSSMATTTTKTVPTTTSVTAPGPTQSGITSSCNKFAQAIKNDGCSTFASRNSITTTQLYAWNTMLGTTGQNCGNQLWTGNYYCVGVSS